MYCRKCGRKIEAGAVKCRKCGEPVDTAEICGGFWGLVESGGKMEEGQQGILAQEQELRNRDARIRALEGKQDEQARQARTWRTAFLGAAAAACLLGIFLIVTRLTGGPGEPDPVAVASETETAAGAESAEHKPDQEPNAGGAGEAEHGPEPAAGPGPGQAEEAGNDGKPADDTAGEAAEADRGDLNGPAADTEAGDAEAGAEEEPAEGLTGSGFNSVVRKTGQEDGGVYDGLEYMLPARALQKIENDREKDGLKLDGTIKYKDDEGGDSVCEGGYSRIDYSTEADEDGDVVWTRKLQKKENGETVSASDRYNTARITDRQTFDPERERVVVIETFETKEKTPNVVTREGMPAYDRIRYVYEMPDDTDEYRLRAEEYYLAGDSQDADSRPVFAIEYGEVREVPSETSETRYEITGTVRDRDQAAQAGFDEIRILYAYTGPDRETDKYRLLELSYRMEGRGADGPDGFAGVTCSYDQESGDRTEQYSFAEEQDRKVSLQTDPMLTWENAWMLFSEDFELRFFRDGADTGSNEKPEEMPE